MDFLTEAIKLVTWKEVVMWVIGFVLIFLAIKKKMEPALLLPMGFGAILVNIPLSNVLNEYVGGVLQSQGIIQWLFEVGIEASEALPILLFIGIGAMIDFGPLISNPKLMILGAFAQLGIFLTIILASLLGFGIEDAASIGIIGAADGPTSILVAMKLGSNYIGPIMVVAYSYMALVPIIQPMVIKCITTRKERRIRMEYSEKNVSKTVKILFPIVITMAAGLIAPKSLALVGFLMFGNLLSECGVLGSLADTAKNQLANLITLLLGITIAFQMQADKFLSLETIMIMGLGLFAFVFDTVGGVMCAKVMNLFSKKKINPMVGAAGISAFPMSARVVHQMGLKEDNGNYLLMHAVGANVSGQIASAVVGGLIIGLVL
ncbi:MAG: sodium ion-translocating decarboxylase subunit beta [Clostridiales bacterium]|mgnify:CR=1 FL=1|nr:sodium ion-translocating decarboxylase subunit beta [Clostridiales bacterium]MDY5726790.1 sodium ion-translocating decarboxylase subunit beta [Eubacteriales bacterium]